MPSALDAAAESRIADIVQLLEYTEGTMEMDLELYLDNIPCDPPTMESQMPGVHSLEWLEHGGQILISGRMLGGVERVSGEGDTLPEAEEGEVGFDDQCTHTPFSSCAPGPIHATTSISLAVQMLVPCQ